MKIDNLAEILVENELTNIVLSLNHIRQLLEASYPGNIGIMELSKFYQIATDKEKNKLKAMIENKKNKQAWEFIQKITGMKLHEN